MAASVELDQEAVLQFLAERGGRARNADLLEHFREFLNSPEPGRRARARERFKELVNAVATVKQEPGSGAKYVQLRKKYRAAAAAAAGAGSSSSSSSSSSTGPNAPAAGMVVVSPAKGASESAAPAAETPRLPPEPPGGGGGSDGRSAAEDAAAAAAAGGPAAAALGPKAPAEPLKEGEEERKATGDPAAPDAPSGQPRCEERAPSAPWQRQPEAPRPGPGEERRQAEGRGEEGGGGSPRPSPGAEEEEPAEAEEEEAPPEEDSSPCSPPSAGFPGAAAAAASGGLLTTTTPRAGRKNFRERMLGSSPQLKRGGGGGGLAPRGGSRGGGGGGGDSDSASLASSSAEEESSGSGGGSVALDPLEHAWMLCASDGRWESLEGLLSCEPALLPKRDFITGFSCLHWAAKHGRHELLALLVNFARRHRLPVDVNARTSGGYTALHLAAMHGHLEVVKLLVGAYDADVDVRDYSGRKAAHYLSADASEEVRSLVGALQDEAGDGAAPNGSGRWRLSKVLPAHLIAYRLSHLHHGEEGGEAAEGAPGKGRELGRKASGSGRGKPRLNKIRFRTQIIHTTPSFRGEAEEEGQEERSLRGSFKLRPKSNVFG